MAATETEPEPLAMEEKAAEEVTDQTQRVAEQDALRSQVKNLSAENILEWTERLARFSNKGAGRTIEHFSTKDPIKSSLVSSTNNIKPGLINLVDSVAVETIEQTEDAYLEARVRNGDIGRVKMWIENKHAELIAQSAGQTADQLLSDVISSGSYTLVDLACEYNQTDLLTAIYQKFEKVPYEEMYSLALKLNKEQNSDDVVKFLCGLIDPDHLLDSLAGEEKEEERIPLRKQESQRVDFLGKLPPGSQLPKIQNYVTPIDDAESWEILKKLLKYQKMIVEFIESGKPVDLDQMQLANDINEECHRLSNLVVEKLNLLKENESMFQTLAERLQSETFSQFTVSSAIYGLVWQQEVLTTGIDKWNDLVTKIYDAYMIRWSKQEINEENRLWEPYLPAKSTHLEYYKMCIARKALFGKEQYAQPIHAKTGGIGAAYFDIVKTQMKLDRLVLKIANETFGIAYLSGAKGLSRIVQKQGIAVFRNWSGEKPSLKKKFKHDLLWNHWDLCRGCISFLSMEALEFAIKRIVNMGEESSEFKILQVDPGFSYAVESEGFPQAVEFTAVRYYKKEEQGRVLEQSFSMGNEKRWQDVKIHVQFAAEDGKQPFICEIQFCLYSFIIARSNLGGHSIYSQYRILDETRRNVVGQKNKDAGHQPVAQAWFPADQDPVFATQLVETESVPVVE